MGSRRRQPFLVRVTHPEADLFYAVFSQDSKRAGESVASFVGISLDTVEVKSVSPYFRNYYREEYTRSKQLGKPVMVGHGILLEREGEPFEEAGLQLPPWEGPLPPRG